VSETVSSQPSDPDPAEIAGKGTRNPRTTTNDWEARAFTSSARNFKADEARGMMLRNCPSPTIERSSMLGPRHPASH